MLVYVCKEQREVINKHISNCIENSTQVNVKKLAIDLGVQEVKEENIPGEASGYLQNSNGKYTIGVEQNDAETRKHFTIAHELAHFLLHKDHISEGNSVIDSRIYRSNLTSDLEVEANRLAADLVMPMNLVRHFVKSTDKITYNQLSDKLGVSLQALKVRLGSPY